MISNLVPSIQQNLSKIKIGEAFKNIYSITRLTKVEIQRQYLDLVLYSAVALLDGPV